jgi:hypothetical protein
MSSEELTAFSHLLRACRLVPWSSISQVTTLMTDLLLSPLLLCPCSLPHFSSECSQKSPCPPTRQQLDLHGHWELRDPRGGSSIPQTYNLNPEIFPSPLGLIELSSLPQSAELSALFSVRKRTKMVPKNQVVLVGV